VADTLFWFAETVFILQKRWFETRVHRVRMLAPRLSDDATPVTSDQGRAEVDHLCGKDEIPWRRDDALWVETTNPQPSQETR
jgi:hypothetical protein